MTGRSARDELREQVAQAISDATLDWCGETPEIWDSHRMAADVAIAVVREALAEPSDPMVDAADAALMRAYKASDWDDAKDVVEGLDVRGLLVSAIAASPLAEPGA